jgi:DNA repair protein RadC
MTDDVPPSAPLAIDQSAQPVAPLDADGHRARLRDRLLIGGEDALHDHEIIEYLLTLVIRRRDTKPIAKALLREFGGFAGVMAADAESLRRVSGMGDVSVGAIKIVEAACLTLLASRIEQRPILGSWQALLDYLRADMGALINERVRVLHLDSRNQLIRNEVMSEGSIDQSAIYVREVVKRALELGSAAIILVHNHPSGDPSPSRQDIAITRDIKDACARLGIALHDHIIVGHDGNHVSMRSQGLV